MVGKQIREMREKVGMTQTKLAERAEIPQGRISDIENDHGNITLSTLARLARALGAKVEIRLTK